MKTNAEEQHRKLFVEFCARKYTEVRSKVFLQARVEKVVKLLKVAMCVVEPRISIIRE